MPRVGHRKTSHPTIPKTRKLERRRFIVFWTIDYGYRLIPENNLDQLVMPAFANDAVQVKFDAFFSRQNAASIIGKKPICDCIGESIEKDGGTTFLIREANLFGE